MRQSCVSLQPLIFGDINLVRAVRSKSLRVSARTRSGNKSCEPSIEVSRQLNSLPEQLEAHTSKLPVHRLRDYPYFTTARLISFRVGRHSRSASLGFRFQ